MARLATIGDAEKALKLRSPKNSNLDMCFVPLLRTSEMTGRRVNGSRLRYNLVSSILKRFT